MEHLDRAPRSRPPAAAAARLARCCLLGLAAVALSAAPAEPKDAVVVPQDGTARIQRVVDDLRLRLAIANEVAVVMVDANPLLVSVETAGGRPGAFRLSFQAGFLGELSGEELEAVIAHELGHVWIFTHHPYLHTEQLANSIAMRAVSRDSLTRVYEKVWRHSGQKGDLVRFLGEASASR
jgi:hypothetical protein